VNAAIQKGVSKKEEKEEEKGRKDEKVLRRGRQRNDASHSATGAALGAR
jgi:hypothetical protein